ncbi:MAG: hypothetical protein IJA14_04720, partial [Alphaproteobacteria bacterium]|nr:hypothetical protein [Alphaproteobacteria bacterium]
MRREKFILVSTLSIALGLNVVEAMNNLLKEDALQSQRTSFTNVYANQTNIDEQNLSSSNSFEKNKDTLYELVENYSLTYSGLSKTTKSLFDEKITDVLEGFGFTEKESEISKKSFKENKDSLHKVIICCGVKYNRFNRYAKVLFDAKVMSILAGFNLGKDEKAEIDIELNAKREELQDILREDYDKYVLENNEVDKFIDSRFTSELMKALEVFGFAERISLFETWEKTQEIFRDEGNELNWLVRRSNAGLIGSDQYWRVNKEVLRSWGFTVNK